MRPRAVIVLGTRPQYVKHSMLARLLESVFDTCVVDTGQHYDRPLSGIFLRELAIPRPDINLRVGSGASSRQVARMLERLAPVLARRRPRFVLVYGDTHSTLAGALAAVLQGIPVAHVESGLRLRRLRSPEEINRRLTDHLASIRFCPTRDAVRRLAREGIRKGVYWTGDLLQDVFLDRCRRVRGMERSVLERYDVRRGGYLLATVHRAENTDDPRRLGRILRTLGTLGLPILLPLHPRTRKALLSGAALPSPAPRGSRVRLLPPLGPLEFTVLLDSCRTVVTDSGGVNREAYFHRVPCVYIGAETPWPETVRAGWCRCAEPERIAGVVRRMRRPLRHPRIFGDGKAAERTVAILQRVFA